MKTKIDKMHKVTVLVLCIFLTGCMSNDDFFAFNDDDYLNYRDLGYDSYEAYISAIDYPIPRQHVSVPNSYHMTGDQGPGSHKKRDKNWVNNQEPTEYTIQLDSGENRAEVAKTLHEAPKDQRSAQIKNEKWGKTYYSGVYGSYPDKQSAIDALKKLPLELQEKAQIERWNSLQNN